MVLSSSRCDSESARTDGADHLSSPHANECHTTHRRFLTYFLDRCWNRENARARWTRNRHHGCCSVKHWLIFVAIVRGRRRLHCRPRCLTGCGIRCGVETGGFTVESV